MVKSHDIKWFEDLLKSGQSRDEKLQQICDELVERVAHYNWVGFYLADNEDEVLQLGPYRGTPTEHIRIGFGQGVCGQAALTHKTLLVQDVSHESNYLACSLDVKSEVVVPILKNGRFVAELDIDSHTKNAFNEEDRLFLERLCAEIARLF